MDDQRRGRRVRSFLIGGVVGASAALAAVRRARGRGRTRTVQGGLTAFEGAPCYGELVERERAEAEGS